jgi:hypothetical protein
MITLTIAECGTVHNTATSTHDTLGDAHHALAQFARAYTITGYGTTGGTLTTRTGRVNQASYVWNIRVTGAANV